MAVVFDGANKSINLTSVGSYDTEADLYSEWKEWVALSDNAKYLPAFDSTGGDSIGSGNSISPYYFLRTDLGWKIASPEEDGDVILVGNLYPRVAGHSLFSPPSGNYTVLIIQALSSQSVTSSVSGGITADQLAAAFSSYGVSTFDPDSDVIENSLTHNDLMKIQSAALAGKVSGSPDGPILIKGVDGTTTRINATVDEDGNRTAVTLTP